MRILLEENSWMHFNNLGGVFNCYENSANKFNGQKITCIFQRLNIQYLFLQFECNLNMLLWDSSIFMCGISPNWVFFKWHHEDVSFMWCGKPQHFLNWSLSERSGKMTLSLSVAVRLDFPHYFLLPVGINELWISRLLMQATISNSHLNESSAV